MSDEVSAVVVHAVEIVTAMDERKFRGTEGEEASAELLAYGGGVGAVVDRVGEPGDGEFEAALGGGDVVRGGCVKRVRPVT